MRHGRLLALWTDTTQAEVNTILSRIPPIRHVDLGAHFPEAGRVDALLDLETVADAEGPVDRTLAALALATSVLLVTADRRLGKAATQAGATVLSPREAAELLA